MRDERTRVRGVVGSASGPVAGVVEALPVADVVPPPTSPDIAVCVDADEAEPDGGFPSATAAAINELPPAPSPELGRGEAKAAAAACCADNKGCGSASAELCELCDNDSEISRKGS